MKKFTKAFWGVCLLLSSLSASEYTKPKKIDLKNGEKIYNTQCAACHGPKGISDINSISPSLNGQYATYMVIQLKAFIDDRPKYKRDSVNSAMMEPYAKNLTTQEMWDVSTYLEGVKERRKLSKGWWDKNGDDVKWAKRYRKSACAACHGDERNGRFPSTPKLGGLQPGYIKAQMDAYEDGSRRGGLSHAMKLLTGFYSDEDLRKIYLDMLSQEEYK